MRLLLLIAAMLWPAVAVGNERPVRLHVPAALVETGLMAHILPRFSLKTQVRVDLVGTSDDADIALTDSAGRTLFRRADSDWGLKVINPDHTGTARLADWLTGGIGQRTILAYAPGGTAIFAAPRPEVRETASIPIEGDPRSGHRISRAKCGRCHAVDDAGRLNDIGSTPSFFLLRGFADWKARFSGFYALNPHPAFTQLAGVTDPFARTLPPAIVPVELTLDDLQDVLAYVAGLPAADLGAPLQHQ